MHIIHHYDHAVVTLDGDVDWPNARALLHSIGLAVDYYGYQFVEIHVASPGGNGRPLRHILDRLDMYRAKGVRFRIRVLSNAASAGAILVALGDDRVAASGARLLFHSSSVYRRGQLNAQECDDLRAALLRSDDELIRRLVERAFSGARTDPEHGALSSDRDVLEGMCIGAPPDPENTAPARIQTLAIALGSTVDDAIAGHDRKSLTGLYRRLFQIDKPISGRLAKTLRLVDRVGDADSGSPAGPHIPSFRTSEGTPFASPAGELPPETLLRHFLVVGGDSDAATSLCLAPLVAGLARAPTDQVGSVLVLHPDPELRSVLHAVARDRFAVLDTDRIVIDLMSGDRSVVPALEAGQWMTAATSILRRTVDLVPGSPARFLLDVSGRVVDSVLREATQLVLSIVAFFLMMTSSRSRCPNGWAPNDSQDGAFVDDLLVRARGELGERGPSVLALAFWLLDIVPGLLPAKIAIEAIDAFGTGGREERELLRGLSNGGEALSFPTGHARDVLSFAQAILSPFAATATRTSLYFGCEPGLNAVEALDIVDLVSGTHDAQFLVLDPKKEGSHGLVAVGLKQLFLEAVLCRAADGGTLPDVPLCGYIARDFERYATDIDAAFLDRAQTTGGFSVLASKSVSAIEHALRQAPGGDAAFGALWSGVGTKLLLRSTDPRTQELARGLAPSRPGIPHVLDVRPLSGLAPDETYVSCLDGRFERRRLAHWNGADPKQADADASREVASLGLPPNAAPVGEPK